MPLHQDIIAGQGHAGESKESAEGVNNGAIAVGQDHGAIVFRVLFIKIGGHGAVKMKIEERPDPIASITIVVILHTINPKYMPWKKRILALMIAQKSCSGKGVKQKMRIQTAAMGKIGGIRVILADSFQAKSGEAGDDTGNRRNPEGFRCNA